MKKKNIILSAIVVALVLIGFIGFSFFKYYQESQKVANTINHNRDILLTVKNKFNEPVNKNVGNIKEDSDLTLIQTSFDNLSTDLSATAKYIKEDAKNDVQKGPNSDTEGLYSEYRQVLDKVADIAVKYASFSKEIACFTKNSQASENILNESNAALDTLDKATTTTTVIAANNKIGDIFDRVSASFKSQKDCFSSSSAKDILAKSNDNPFKQDLEITFKNLSAAFYGVATGVKENDIQKVNTFNQSIKAITSAETVSPETQFKAVFDAYQAELDILQKEFVKSIDDLNSKISKVGEKYGLEDEK